MKTGLEHKVPLSLLALDVLGRVLRRDGSPYVFWGSGSEPISDTSLRNVLRGIGIDRHTATPHGFRSTFRDWTAEHGIGGKQLSPCRLPRAPGTLRPRRRPPGSRVGRRTTFFEERRKVMQSWGLYLC
jgi:hypothetical protein